MEKGYLTLFSLPDARNITTTYGYADPLNRPTGKTYSDGTPPVSFSYDQTSVTLGTWSSGTLLNTKGRLTSGITTTSGTLQTGVAYSYDPMGRPLYYWQCTPVNCGNTSIWTASYLYDKAGDITNWTHPEGFSITQTINGARQVSQVTSTWNDSTHPPVLAQNIRYTPWGALSSLQNGCAGTGCTNAEEDYSYNNRMQVSQIQLGPSGSPGAYNTLVYNYSLPGGTTPPGCPVAAAGSGNNGDVIG